MVHLFNRNWKIEAGVHTNRKRTLVVGVMSSVLLALVPSSGASASGAAGTALTVVSGIGEHLSSWGWNLLYYGALFSISAFIIGLLLPLKPRGASHAAQA